MKMKSEKSKKQNKRKKHFFFSLLVCYISFFPLVKFERLLHKKKATINKKRRVLEYVYTNMKTKQKCRRICSQFKKKKRRKPSRRLTMKRTTIIMQLVRIWHLRESQGREEKVI
jgi:hypothetical protein